MSQLETNPLNNPTIRVSNLTQVLDVKPPAQVTDFRFDPATSVKPNQTFTIEQADWVKIAAKNKAIANADWVINTDGDWFTLDVDFALVKRLLTVGPSFNSFANFNTLMISIKTTNNAMFQGLTMVTWDNAPTNTFYFTVKGLPVSATDAKAIYSQFNRVNISPKTSGEINVLIPLNYPFEMFKFQKFGNSNYNYNADYLEPYRFGTLRFTTVSPLEAVAGSLTRLSFSISAQVMDLETAGLCFRADVL